MRESLAPRIAVDLRRDAERHHEAATVDARVGLHGFGFYRTTARFGKPAMTDTVERCVPDGGEAADEDLPDALRVQRFAEREEIFELRCA